MVKTVIYFTLLSGSVLAHWVPEAYQRRDEYENDLLLSRDSDPVLEERDFSPSIFNREADTAILQEREPFFFLAPLLAGAARAAVQVGIKALPRVASRVGSKVVKHEVKNQVNQQQNNRRKRDIEPEDEIDLVVREDMDEFVERELDLIEREMNQDDILRRELEDLYLD